MKNKISIVIVLIILSLIVSCNIIQSNTTGLEGLTRYEIKDVENEELAKTIQQCLDEAEANHFYTDADLTQFDSDQEDEVSSKMGCVDVNKCPPHDTTRVRNGDSLYLRIVDNDGNYLYTYVVAAIEEYCPRCGGIIRVRFNSYIQR